MTFQVVYKPLAQIEAAEAYVWYARPEIGMGDAFLTELARTDGFLANNPLLYPCIEDEIHRANLSRFPFSLFFVIDGDVVNVLSCFHQHREPKTRAQLL
ncbi:addiction module toxin RelE [Janthinobacterium sp. ROICE36]|uniref:type II toxin-antitoxin system RelE/ParE family toxin n=1 Tax=Janthinobacterium sp. ROICE36 TaxID=2048670 RepID=UPI000C7F6B90|nr:type II toxin-antitoxin system RelE/ParE family toxin [Janthinobacterium sp. ROICE36]PLY44080.1 addiction module toxin RelE [Janthinobacterium sp. ROICE36]